MTPTTSLQQLTAKAISDHSDERQAELARLRLQNLQRRAEAHQAEADWLREFRAIAAERAQQSRWQRVKRAVRNFIHDLFI